MESLNQPYQSHLLDLENNFCYLPYIGWPQKYTLYKVLGQLKHIQLSWSPTIFRLKNMLFLVNKFTNKKGNKSIKNVKH